MRSPYFESPRVTLYCGDSREVLAEMEAEGKHFDLLLTDPPYGLNQNNGMSSGVNARRGKAKYSDDLFDDTLEYQQEVVAPVLKQSLVLCDLGIVTVGIRVRNLLPPPVEEGCMYQPASVSFNTWGHQDYSPIFYYGKPHGCRSIQEVVAHRDGARLLQGASLCEAFGVLEETHAMRDGRRGG